MSFMCIIGCRIFEDEIVHLIKNDCEINRVLVIDRMDAVGLLRKLSENHISHTVCLENEIGYLLNKQNTNYCLVINILGFSLDASPQLLKESVYQQINIMSEYADIILVFYGLCVNVLGNINKDFEQLSCPVHILREENGDIVDDCIGTSLGGRRPYLSVLKKAGGEGIYFLTPMAATYWKEMAVVARLTDNPDNIEMTKIVFDYAGYRKVGKINTGLFYEKNFDEKVKEFANSFDFQIVEIQGSTKIAQQSYYRAKEAILGKKGDY